MNNSNQTKALDFSTAAPDAKWGRIAANLGGVVPAVRISSPAIQASAANFRNAEICGVFDASVIAIERALGLSNAA